MHVVHRYAYDNSHTLPSVIPLIQPLFLSAMLGGQLTLVPAVATISQMETVPSVGLPLAIRIVAFFFT